LSGQLCMSNTHTESTPEHTQAHARLYQDEVTE
jgi:hypothetical protein